MRIAICDDNKDCRELLLDYVNCYFNDKQICFDVEEFTCGEDLLDSNLKFDIVFLDIEMGTISGIKAAEELNKRNRNTIIFIVTAYNSYLDDAMDLKVFRFIDKNLISPERIYSSLDKALLQINQGDIIIRTLAGESIKIPKNDIMYIEVNKRETTIVTIDDSYKTRESLNSFKAQIASNYFVVPHNSFIVNLNYVSKYQREELTMKNGKIIYISQKKQPEIRRKFFAYTLEE